MNAIALPRMAAITLPTFDLAGLAKDVYNQLSYRPLVQHLEVNKALLILQGMGCSPFVPEAVDAYKRTQVRKAMGWRRFNPLHRLWRWWAPEGVVSWNRCSIHEFIGEIPVSVLQRAVDVTNRLARERIGHRIGVEYLGVRDEMEVTYDPFLYVRVGESARFYIEVWDEPGFFPKRVG